MPKKTTKSKIESHPFFEYISNNWKRDPAYVAAYLRGAALVRINDDIFEDLIFLSHNKKIQIEQYAI